MNNVLLPSRPTPYLIRPRPVPSFLFLASTIFLNFSVPGLLIGHTTPYPLFLVFLTFAATWLICFVKNMWIPNPKDDIFSPESFRERLMKFGSLSLVVTVWLVTQYVSFKHITGIQAVGVQSILPFVVHLLSMKFTIRKPFTLPFLITLGAFFFGSVIMSISVGFTSNASGSILLSILATLCQCIIFVSMEKIMMERNTDPWVLVSDLIPVSTVSSLALFLLFEAYSFSPAAFNLHPTLSIVIALIGAIHIISTSFLISCLSSISLAAFCSIRDSIFFLLFWIYYNQVGAWGILGFAILWFGVFKFNVGVGMSSGIGGTTTRYIHLSNVPDDLM